MIFPRIIKQPLNKVARVELSLANLITLLNLKLLQKLPKNYKNIAFRGQAAANCTLMADSI